MFKRIDHVEIVPSNLDRSLKFYTEILGFKLQWRRKVDRTPLEEIAFLELGDSLVEMFSVKGPAPVSKEPWQIGCRRIALVVEDVVKVVEYLQSKGVEIVGNLADVEKSKRAIIKDPDGLPIELVQRE